MANSAQFLAKVAEKPKWMSAQEQAKTFAGPGGWYMKNGNPAAAPELIETIPGLSSIIDYDSAGNLVADIGTLKIQSAVLSRRSRRGYNIILSFEEQFKNVATGDLGEGNGVEPIKLIFLLGIDGAATAVTDTNGDPMGNFDKLAPIPLEIDANATVGRLSFPIPTFDSNPGSITIQFATPFLLLQDAIGTQGVSGATSITGAPGMTDSEGNALTTVDYTSIAVGGDYNTITLSV